MSTAVYRWYGENDCLLYVGIASNVAQRAAQHRDDKPWWSQVRMCRVEHFDSREEALRREASLIRRLGPLYNIQHNGRMEFLSVDDRRRTQRLLRRDDEVRRLDETIRRAQDQIVEAAVGFAVRPGGNHVARIEQLRRCIAKRRYELEQVRAA